MTFHGHVNVQEDRLKKLKALNIERLHAFLVNILRGRFFLTDEDADLLADDEAERIIIYAKVYIFDYVGGIRPLLSAGTRRRHLRA